MKQINIKDLWGIEWKNAYRFFNSKGNVKTKSRYKDIWYKRFKEMLQNLEEVINDNFAKEIKILKAEIKRLRPKYED